MYGVHLEGYAVTAQRLRLFVLVLFIVGSVGTGAELILLGHVEDGWQLAPVVLLGASLLALGWQAAERGPRSTRVFQIAMVLCVASGVSGLWLHYAGNAEFELEMYPSLSGLDLFQGAIAGATPTLAPGTMIELGLLGLAYTYRHPFLAAAKAADHTGVGS